MTSTRAGLIPAATYRGTAVGHYWAGRHLGAAFSLWIIVVLFTWVGALLTLPLQLGHGDAIRWVPVFEIAATLAGAISLPLISGNMPQLDALSPRRFGLFGAVSAAIWLLAFAAAAPAGIGLAILWPEPVLNPDTFQTAAEIMAGLAASVQASPLLGFFTGPNTFFVLCLVLLLHCYGGSLAGAITAVTSFLALLLLQASPYGAWLGLPGAITLPSREITWWAFIYLAPLGALALAAAASTRLGATRLR